MLSFTFTYTYLSSAYNSLVSGFVGNTNINPITHVKLNVNYVIVHLKLFKINFNFGP
jgi:hypothetical protein